MTGPRVIYKYPLRITDFQAVSVPDGAQFLSAQMQGDMLCPQVHQRP